MNRQYDDDNKGTRDPSFTTNIEADIGHRVHLVVDGEVFHIQKIGFSSSRRELFSAFREGPLQVPELTRFEGILAPIDDQMADHLQHGMLPPPHDASKETAPLLFDSPPRKVHLYKNRRGETYGGRIGQKTRERPDTLCLGNWNPIHVLTTKHRDEVTCSRCLDEIKRVEVALPEGTLTDDLERELQEEIEGADKLAEVVRFLLSRYPEDAGHAVVFHGTQLTVLDFAKGQLAIHDHRRINKNG